MDMPSSNTTFTKAQLQAQRAEADRRRRMMSSLWKFTKDHKAEDFARTSPSGEKTIYTHSHRNLKVKGGHNPKEYGLVEAFVDLGTFLKAGDLEGALPIYYKLRRVLGE